MGHFNAVASEIRSVGPAEAYEKAYSMKTSLILDVQCYQCGPPKVPLVYTKIQICIILIYVEVLAYFTNDTLPIALTRYS